MCELLTLDPLGNTFSQSLVVKLRCADLQVQLDACVRTNRVDVMLEFVELRVGAHPWCEKWFWFICNEV